MKAKGKASDASSLGGLSMSVNQPVSRRASLKSLGVVGAAMVFNRATEASAPPAEAKTAKSDHAKPTANAVDVAVARFGKGHSCAQAVFSAFAEQTGMDYQAAVRVSSGFGGGMGMGSVCGAVTGAIMAIGLRYGGIDPKAKGQTGKLVREFTDRFKAQHKSVNCRDLLSCDLSTPEGLKEAKDKNLFATICNGIVKDAATMLSELLAQQKPG
jgi:C_GCAxxG_C_C family probable redox protein